MTRARRFGKDTPFGKWLRTHRELSSAKGFDAENLDYVWHHYFDGKLMLVEEKRFQGPQPLAQADTHCVIDQLLSTGQATNRRGHSIIYYGYYLLRFEKTSPIDGRMWLNGREITVGELSRFLQFDLEMLNKFPRKKWPWKCLG